MVNEWLLERDQCAWALVASSTLLICGAFTGIGFLYHVSWVAGLPLPLVGLPLPLGPLVAHV